jgi:uncharacterized 2Fe-2S/4Fe-4S cluster protein (DUF4445 family)
MSNVTVTFLPSNTAIEVPQGESIIRAAMAAGVHINASCGGDGVCGKCRVIVEAGQVQGEPSERISAEDRAKGYCLACKTLVQGDVSVRVPVESTIDTSALQRKAPRRTASVQQIGFEEIKQQGLFVPAVEKIYVELTPPDAQDHLPDVTRLVNHLRMHHNEHGIEVELPVIRKIPTIFREQDFKVTVTLARPVRNSGKNQIINVQAGDTTAQNYAVAMDIGTTTVFGQLVDLVSGQALAEHGEFNGQISYGEDVISRIMFAEKPGGLETMQQVVIATVNKVLGQLLKQSKVSRENISLITFAGNTTMTQLLLAVEPRFIRRSPYVPTATVYPPIRATDLGVDLDSHVTALVYPQVSSYVGGDIVAGVMGSGMYRTEKLTLFMDIGTNAEVVVGNKDWMACAACSAGPAFEGGGIQFGMRAAKGAIEDFSIDPETLEPMIVTIGHLVRNRRHRQSGQVRSRPEDRPYPRERKRLRVRAGLPREHPDRSGHHNQRDRHRQPDPRQGGHLQRLQNAAQGGGHVHGERGADHPGRRLRQLCRPGAGHDHRPAARSRTRKGDLRGQQLAAGCAHERPDQQHPPAGGGGHQHDDQLRTLRNPLVL